MSDPMSTAREAERERREHVAAQPQTIGSSTGLVYCMACGYLLSSDTKGRTARADKTCTPVRVTTRTEETQ